MYASRSFLLSCLAVVCLLGAAQATIVIFGDSLSDDGHGANPVIHDALSTSQIDVGIYPPAPYYKGHFSNGPSWPEIAAPQLGQELENLATGNAATGSVPGAFTVEPPFAYLTSPAQVPVPSSYQQAMSYAALHGGSINPNNWYVIWIGANDFVYTANGVQQATVAGMVQYINMTMTAAYSAGARKFVVFNMPMLAALPMFSPPFRNATASAQAKAYLNSQVPMFNTMVAQLVQAYPSTHPGATVLPYDVNGFFNTVTSNLAKYNFTNAADPCYMGPSFFDDITGFFDYPSCPNPSSYVFWDVVHPTKHFHYYLGNDFANTFRSQISVE